MNRPLDLLFNLDRAEIFKDDFFRKKKKDQFTVINRENTMRASN